MRGEDAPIIMLWLGIFWLIYYGARIKDDDENDPQNYLEKIKVRRFKFLLWLKNRDSEVLKLSYVSQLFAIGSLIFGIIIFLILLLYFSLVNQSGDNVLRKYLIYFPFLELIIITIYNVFIYAKESNDRRRVKKQGAVDKKRRRYKKPPNKNNCI